MNNGGGGGGGAARGAGALVNLDSSVLLADAEGFQRHRGPLEPYRGTPHGLSKLLFHCWAVSFWLKE